MGRYKTDEEIEEVSDQPPKLIDELAKVAKSFMEKNYKHLNRLAPRVPREPINIAKWWVSIERQFKPGYEDCRKLTGKISKKEAAKKTGPKKVKWSTTASGKKRK